MDIGRMLLEQSNNIDVGTIASRLGLSEEQASQAVSAVLPALLGGVKHAENNGNLEQIAGLADGAQAPADNIENGNAILGQLMGGGDWSSIITHAAAQTGLSESVIQSVLPMAGNMIGQQVSTQMAGGGGLGGIAGQILGQLGGGGDAAAAAPAEGGGMFGGLMASLDRDGDGNPLDDILGAFGGGQR